MKIPLPVILSAFVVLAVSTTAGEPNLPPTETKEEWTTLEKKGFNDWNIAKFDVWSGAADGGSIVFRFQTDRGIGFSVVVADTHYWTAADKKAKRQVIYVVESGRYYLLVPDSMQEKQLVRILTKAAATQKGKVSGQPRGTSRSAA
jgi:hypothetical protein